jgi:hypothetical protein
MIDPTRFAGTDQDVHGLLGKQQALRSEARTEKQVVADLRPIPKHEQGGRFVRGPVPYDWLRVALSFGGKAGNLAWALWWLVGIERVNPVRLTARVLRDFSISTRASRRLLVDFERAGLLRVDRQRGRGPVVEIVKPSPEPPSDE